MSKHEVYLYLYDEGGFQGNKSGPLTESDLNLAGPGFFTGIEGWNDDIESLMITGNPNGFVRVCRDADYKGGCWDLKPGVYDARELGIIGVPINEISSFEIHHA